MHQTVGNLIVNCVGFGQIGCEPTTLVDDVKNSLPLSFPWPEAMYVNGDVTVDTFATLDLNGINVY